MNRFIFAISVALASPVFASSEVSSEVSSQIVSDVPRPVITERVGTDALEAITFVGTVAAGNVVTLGFPISGTLAERNATLGTFVSKGDILARLDPKDFEAEVRSAEARVRVAQTNLGTAQDTADRSKELSERGVDSATRLEDGLRALVAAQAGVEQAQANLARAQDRLDLGDLRAPQDGVITGAFLDAGASVSPGLEVVRLASTDEREVIVDISEQGLADLDIGMRFDVALVANPRLVATATLFRIDPVANGATRSRRAHLLLSEPPAGFRFGALVRIKAVENSGTVASLPLSAIVDPDGAASVWVVDRANNTVSAQPVTLGEQFGTRVRVTNGISVGDEVVLRGIHSLHDGQIIGRSMSQ